VQQALECLEELQQLEPGYRDTEVLLSRVRQELAPPPTVGVPGLSGQKASQASNTLANKGLKLDVQRGVASETMPEGRIIEQSPEAGAQVEAGSVVSVTVSSGPSSVEVPDLVGKSRSEAKSMLHGVGLELGMIVKVSSDDVPEDEIVQQHPATGIRVERGASVRVTVAHKRVEEPKAQKSTKRPLSPRPDFLPEEPEPTQSERLEDHPGESTGPSVGRELSTIERYREMVEDYYKGGWDRKEVEVSNRLRQFTREWGISQDHADSIEREVTGDTKEAVRGQTHQTESAPSSEKSEEPSSQYGRKSEKPPDLPD